MPERGRRLTVRARAKVNLALEILSRRADGYHELATLLSAVDLADRVTLEIAERGATEPISLTCDAAGVPPGADNLAWRAAELLRREVGDAPPVRIRIAKRIPVAAGLGGGSADAAAVLAGLPRLWRTPLRGARREALATALGMDVPFFLGESPALGLGRGERLSPVAPPRRALALVLVNPGFPLATREVYGRLRATDFGDGGRVRRLAAALAAGPAAVAAGLVNGLEAAAGRLWPGLAAVKAALLRAGALAAVMSGSGPTVVGVAASRDAGHRIARALAGEPWRIWVTRTVAGPPLAVVGERRAGDRPRGAWGVAKR